jgi:hypothetical protein
MLDPAVRIACLSNGCCDCSPGGDARRATGTCARRKRVIDAGAFRTARGSASGGIGRSTRLLAVRSRRLAARRTERERHCAEGDGHCLSGLSAGPCHRLLPLPRRTFSEIGRHAEFITVRLYRFDTIDTIGSRRKNGDFGDSSARESPWYMRSSSPSFARDCHGTLTLVDRSTPRLPGLQSHCKTSVSVPAPLSPLRHAVGWEAVTVRTVLAVLWLVA